MPEAAASTPPGAPVVPRVRDAVRAHLAQALARRADAHTGAARRVLDEKLAALTCVQGCACEEAPVAARAPATHGALAELVAHAHASRQETSSPLAPMKPRDAAAAAAAEGAATDARTVQFFKRTWSRLSADQRLAQSRATLPDNAGPLNSHHLVHRSLTLMHALSPDYLECFVGYIDALQWLEQANEAAQDALGAGRAANAKKSMPARR